MRRRAAAGVSEQRHWCGLCPGPGPRQGRVRCTAHALCAGGARQPPLQCLLRRLRGLWQLRRPMRGPVMPQPPGSASVVCYGACRAPPLWQCHCYCCSVVSAADENAPTCNWFYGARYGHAEALLPCASSLLTCARGRGHRPSGAAALQPAALEPSGHQPYTVGLRHLVRAPCPTPIATLDKIYQVAAS